MTINALDVCIKTNTVTDAFFCLIVYHNVNTTAADRSANTIERNGSCIADLERFARGNNSNTIFCFCLYRDYFLISSIFSQQVSAVNDSSVAVPMLFRQVDSNTNPLHIRIQGICKVEPWCILDSNGNDIIFNVGL